MCARTLNRTGLSNASPKAIHHHFSRIAPKYRYLRTTDLKPVTLIVDKLKNLAHIEAADIGCGGGRYDLLLCKYLGEKLRLTCVDANADMLGTLEPYLLRHGISNFTSMRSSAEHLPFPNNALDCVCTFNAIHHFNLPDFLRESARILKIGGYLFVYTRLREQNRRNIWGRYFPGFHQKETRLYALDALKQSIAAVANLEIESIDYFKYERMSTLDQLVERAGDHHYSTFFLYSPEELEEAIAGFTQKLGNVFDDTQRVRWFDENVLLIIRNQN